MANKCECGYPLITFYAVNYKEKGCMSCGNTYPMFCGLDDLEETEEVKKKIEEAEKLKDKIYATLKIDDNGISIGINEEEFKKRLNEFKEVKE